MAVGWARDGAVQEQIDADLQDAVKRARNRIPAGESRTHCIRCEVEIPEKRRLAIPGVRYCVDCQADMESRQAHTTGINRRGSKDSQLR